MTIGEISLPAVTRHEVRKKIRALRIKPTFQSYLGRDFEFSLYVGFMEHILEKMLPPSFLQEFCFAKTPQLLKKSLEDLHPQLPILKWSTPENGPGLIYITTFAKAEFIHGLGRFMSDFVSRWLIPGKQLPILCAPSLNFHFVEYDKDSYYIQQVILEVSDESDLSLAKSNIPRLSREGQLILLGVSHARNIMAKKTLSLEEKKATIEDKLDSLLNLYGKAHDTSLFEHMQQFLLHVSGEDKINQIKDQIVPLLRNHPKAFDPDIFHEIQHVVLLFREKFLAIRDINFITRLIAYQYLFRKRLKQQLELQSKERVVVVKILKTTLTTPEGTRQVLGVMVGMNILRENELFDQKHSLEAIRHCIPRIRRVKDSYVLDTRGQERIRLFYLEVEKEDGSSFSLAEMKELRKKLPRELQLSVENVTHPVFMPRNEEEVMRNILLLSQELKYVRDIPQVVISFDMQTESQLVFTVILLRILQPKEHSLQQILDLSKSSIQFQDFDIKSVGLLRKKYVKEANIFSARLDKKPFLRKDYTLDLFKARQVVSAELAKILGDIRDFNGGILSKQHELFHELRQSLLCLGQNNDFLLENFFYSITPPLMQSLLPSTILRTLFLMMVESLEHEFDKNPFFLKTHWDPEHLLLMTSAVRPFFKEAITAAIHELKIPSSELCYTHVKVYEIVSLGYIYRCEDPKKCALFYQTVQQAAQNWEKFH